MGRTKGQLISLAFEEIGLASYVFDLDPAQLQNALYKMDDMLADWGAKGVRIGYNAGGKLDTDSNLPDYANAAVIKNLAIALASTVGKQVSAELTMAAKKAYTSLVGIIIGTPGKIQMPGTMPAGAGNKPWRTTNRVYLDEPSEDIANGEDSDLPIKI